MNKVLVAGILGLMLTACGQKEEAAAPAATLLPTLLQLLRKPPAKPPLP